MSQFTFLISTKLYAHVSPVCPAAERRETNPILVLHTLSLYHNFPYLTNLFRSLYILLFYITDETITLSQTTWKRRTTIHTRITRTHIALTSTPAHTTHIHCTDINLIVLQPSTFTQAVSSTTCRQE